MLRLEFIILEIILRYSSKCVPPDFALENIVYRYSARHLTLHLRHNEIGIHNAELVQKCISNQEREACLAVDGEISFADIFTLRASLQYLHCSGNSSYHIFRFLTTHKTLLVYFGN